ncbi:MAG: gliding motility-associated ABC transporter ATP-binding subunit GldA [Vicingaceae bacterium]
MSIIVKQVTKKYGEQKALDNVSFKINPGEIIGFLGPNGAGKSTMMKIITCFIPPTSGKVNVCGFDVATNEMEIKRRIGYLPENNPLYLDLYVKEYLELVGGIHKLDHLKDRINEIIKTVGLDIEQNKKIGELSKGYKQRVGLAQALIHDPEVLILDEPTTGLDPIQLEEIRNLIKKIGKEKTVMLSTHIMQEVEAICDRVIIINKGKIVADDTTKDLQKVNDNITVFVEFDKIINKEDLLSIDGVINCHQKNETSWYLEIQHEATRNKIFKYAVEKDITVLTIQKESVKMEDIFKKYTSK